MPVATQRLPFELTDAEADEIHGAIKLLHGKLVPHLVDLGPEERRGLLKMGDKTVAFVGKTLAYAREHPQLRPPFIDMDAFSRDWQTVQTLRAMQRPLTQLADLLDDSLMLAGSGAYTAARACYRVIQGAADLNVPGAATIAADLGRRFPGRTAKAAAPDDIPADDAGGARAPRKPGAEE